MLFRQIFLQLAACTLLLLSTVHCLPTSPSQTPASVNKPNPFKDASFRKAFNKWVFKKSRENFEKHKDWLVIPDNLYARDAPCPGEGENERWFVKQSISKSDIEGIILDDEKLKSILGDYNEGVYNVTKPFTLQGDPNEYPGDGAYLVKLVELKRTASCEPYALEEFGVWHRTWTHEDKNGRKSGAILLKRVPGEYVYSNELWRKSDPGQKLVVLNQVREKGGKDLFNSATNSKKKLFRHDLNVGNFLCEIVINENTGQIEAKGVEQIDLGPPGVHWRKGEELDESKFWEWYNREFDLRWSVEHYFAHDPRILDEYLASLK